MEVNVESQTRDKTKGVHWLPTIHYEMGGRIKELEATTSRSMPLPTGGYNINTFYN